MPESKQGISSNRIAICYALIHALVELICFCALFRRYGGPWAWVAALAFDTAAFVPQALFAQAFEVCRFRGMGAVGTALLAYGAILSAAAGTGLHLAGIILMGLGNAVLHECGAIATVRTGEGRLFPAALFVSGGSFGLVIGQALGTAGLDVRWLLVPAIVIQLLVRLTDNAWTGEAAAKSLPYPEYALTARQAGVSVVVVAAFAVTAVRSFIGYAIPISWKKELWQAFLLFFMMGLGKALGGWCTDRFGARKTGVVTTLLCIPFLILGEEQMVISIIGVLLFSMTMPITFGMLLSVLPQAPGLAFGVTTIALFAGLLPLFAFGNFSVELNRLLVVVLSAACSAVLAKTLK